MTSSESSPNPTIIFYTLLYGYDLVEYIDGSLSYPSITITNNGTTVLNPEFKLWMRQDSLLRHPILASVDNTIAPLVSYVKSDQESWDQLHTTFANNSQTRIYGLRDSLSKITKDKICHRIYTKHQNHC
ncbi:hypothetical protein ACOSQ2_027591 [Xanthoceras sorbifolium]